MKLERSFYLEPDVVALSQKLLGKLLLTRFNGLLTGGIITETEAYQAPEDKASHAYGGRRTARTEIMFAEGGRAYVYLCYGIHHLFNIVTNAPDIPHAILVRALFPTIGLPHMLERRKAAALTYKLTSGPGSAAEALGIKRHHSGIDLTGDEIWIEDVGLEVPPNAISTSPRIGIDYAEEYALKPWRFVLQNGACAPHSGQGLSSH